MVPFDPKVLEDRHNTWFESDVDKAKYLDIVGLETEESFVHLLDGFGAILQSPDRRVTGSLWIKRYSSLIVSAMYVWIRHGYGIDLSLDRVKVLLNKDGINLIVLDYRQLDLLKSFRSGEQQTEVYLQHLFSVNVCPVFKRTVQHSGIQEATLWATLSYSLAYWKEEWIREDSSSEVRLRIDDVYRRMAEHAKPEWFVEKTTNPLNCRFRSVENPFQTDKHILLREKCCLNYRLPGEDRYCYTCPLISDERRIEKYQSVHGGA